MPSSREQICATAGAEWLSTEKLGRTRLARSMNRRTASYWLTISVVSSLDASGSVRDGTR
jgi:hypothetical protein